MSDELTELTPEKREKFLENLSKGFSVTKAAAAAGMTRQGFYKARASSEEFAEQWEAAIEAGADILEDEALRRAKDGTLKPVFQGGIKVGQVREYSDTLMIFLLKGRRPEKYKDRGDFKHSGLIQTQNIPLDLSALTDDDLNALEAINAKLASSPSDS